MPQTALSELAVYAARPTVRIDRQDYPKVSELVTAMEMTEHDGGMSSLELRLTNVASDPFGGADLAFEDDTILRLGAAISIYAGDETAPREIFSGLITGLEADFPSADTLDLVVLAEDAFQQARFVRRTKVYADLKIADLARQIASQLGLTPVVTGLTRSIGVQVQLNESDLAFFRRLLHRYDADAQVVGKELHVSPRADVQRGTLELDLYTGQLRRARALADLAHQVTEVTVAGWDATRGKRVVGRSRGANAGPGSGQTGAQVHQRAIGARHHHVSHLAVTTDAEAQAVADAAFDERARRFVTVEATTEGNPLLRVGTSVTLSGLGPRFENTYYVTRASHRYDQERGYETDFEAESAFWGGR